jgi:hypothetical protein
MRRSTVRTLLVFCATLLTTVPAFAQVRVEVVGPPPPRVVVAPPRVVVAPPPVVRFEAPPPLTVVSPGVQVVRDSDEEVFFTGGYYWHAGPDGTWYRTRSYRGGWVVAPRHMVPGAIVRMPRGQYRHYRGEGWHEQRREERHEEKALRHEQKREDKAERRWEKHGRRG